MSARRRTWMAISGALGILLVVGVGVWLKTHNESPLFFDLQWQSIPLVDTGGPLEGIALAFAFIGSAQGVAILGAIAIMLFLLTRRLRDAATITTSLALGVLCSELLKRWIERPRQDTALIELSDFSYPSGHSMGAAALSVSIVLVLAALHRANRQAKIASSFNPLIGTLIAVLWTAMMMWSRTALGVHWLSDTIAGAILGLSAALVAQAIWGSSGENHRAFIAG